jgi:hypothetical protein
MSFEMQVIDTLLFNILLFALFCYYFKSLVEQYVLPFLNDEITVEQKRFHDLNKQKIVLSMEKDNLVERLQEQDLQFNHVEKQVMVWYQNLKKREQEGKPAWSHMQEQIAQRRKIQQEHLHMRFSYSTVVPYALVSVRRKLIAVYQGEQGREGMNAIIDELGEA